MIKRDINETSTNSQVNNAVNSKKFKSPIFQQDFDIAKDKLGSMDLVYALVIIRFLCTRNKDNCLTKRDGKIWAPNIIDRLCYWMDISPDTSRRLLNKLEALGIINIALYRTYFKTSLHVTVVDLKGIPVPFIELTAMRKAIKAYGSLSAAFIFFKLGFHSNNKKGEDTYFVSSIVKLAAWAKLCEKTIHKILQKLMGSNALIRKTAEWNERSRSHFHIPKSVMKFFLNEHPVDKPGIDSALLPQKYIPCNVQNQNHISSSILNNPKKNNLIKEGGYSEDRGKELSPQQQLPAYKAVEFEKRTEPLCRKSFLETFNMCKTNGDLNYV